MSADTMNTPLTPTGKARGTPRPGLAAQAALGWWPAHRWLLLRRVSQLGILALFLAGPWFGLWLVKGNLASSLTFGVLPLTDPYLLAQTLATGHLPYREALIGGAIVTVFYLLIGGRVFCAWVCPMNIVTDAAAWLRRRLGIKTSRAPDSNTRYWLLGGTLVAAAISGHLAWEWVNPVSLLQRGLIFGLAGSWGVVLAVFIYDLLLAGRGWCGHLCPTGAFYRLFGHTALLSVAAPRRASCDDCMDCFNVCPEPQVIRPALKQVGQTSPLILSADCTRCGRCVDVCAKQVFKMTHRFDQRST